MWLRMAVWVRMDEDVCSGEYGQDALLRSHHDPMGGFQGQARIQIHVHLQVNKGT